MLIKKVSPRFLLWKAIRTCYRRRFHSIESCSLCAYYFVRYSSFYYGASVSIKSDCFSLPSLIV